MLMPIFTVAMKITAKSVRSFADSLQAAGNDLDTTKEPSRSVAAQGAAGYKTKASTLEQAIARRLISLADWLHTDDDEEDNEEGGGATEGETPGESLEGGLDHKDGVARFVGSVTLAVSESRAKLNINLDMPRSWSWVRSWFG